MHIGSFSIARRYVFLLALSTRFDKVQNECDNRGIVNRDTLGIVTAMLKKVLCPFFFCEVYILY